MILLTLNLLLASAQLDTTIYNDSILCAPLGITLKALRPIKYEPVAKKRILSFSVFPNPTNDVSNIQLSFIPSNELTYVVSDILGRELYHETMLMQSNRHSINLQQFENGTYLLRVMKDKELLFHTSIQVLK
jgi:hypothetical protein